LELYRLHPWWLCELQPNDNIRLVVAAPPQVGGSTIMVSVVTVDCSSEVSKCVKKILCIMKVKKGVCIFSYVLILDQLSNHYFLKYTYFIVKKWTQF
jgi:hypothetical protein